LSNTSINTHAGVETGGHGIRIGIDVGGTKIAIAALAADGREVYTHRITSPRGDYNATIAAIGQLVIEAEAQLSISTTVGIAMPGSISPATGLVQNSNSVWLNAKPLAEDLSAHMGRPLRFANDANCFALSEAADGAAAGAKSVFGVILGTGCGGGLVYNGQIVDGPRGIGGEWGHTPLPWPSHAEVGVHTCWCGRSGCLETWLSGTALYQDYLDGGGEAALAASAEEVVRRAADGDAVAQAAMDRHADRLARGLSMITNIFDPEVIVLGGGLSKLPHLYAVVPGLMRPYIFSDNPTITIRPPVHGDASGVRGAARLWDTA
jgi:fructokinase